jgi:chromosome partitioning protein
MNKPRIIAFSNQKGGVGKSTSTINISAILGDMGYKVLVMDLDPQSNTSMGLGVALDIDELDEINTVYECIMEGFPLQEAIVHTKFKNVDSVPAGLKLANAEQELVVVLGRELKLKKALALSMDKLDYDFIFFDLCPNLGLLNTNGLVAAKEVIIPVDSVFAVSGIRQLQNYINRIKSELNENLFITGVLLNNIDCRTNLARDVHSEVHNFFQNRVFKNVVRHNIKIQEAQWEQKPISYYDPKSIGSEDYSAVAKEVIERGDIK